MPDSVYGKIVERIKESGHSFIDSGTMLKRYIEELTRRRERLCTEESTDQAKLSRMLMNGSRVVQILRVSVKAGNEMGGNVQLLNFSITPIPIKSNKVYNEVRFPFKGSPPILLTDAIEEFILFITSKYVFRQ